MGKRDYFREEVDRLKKEAIDPAVTKMCDGNKDPNDWLMTLYKGFSDRMLSDNERIWKTGAILVPLSLSAFAALVSIKDIAPWKVGALGFASSALLWCWLIIAENHRAFQQKSEAWLVAIQETIGIEKAGVRWVFGNFANRVFIFAAAVQWMRWILAIGVTAAWIIFWWAARSGCLT